jgi:hypothetical protein
MEFLNKDTENYQRMTESLHSVRALHYMDGVLLSSCVAICTQRLLLLP